MHPFWRRLTSLHDAATSASFAVAACVLGGIAGAFCYEVAARYLFSAPTSWANAFVSYMLCAAIFLAVPELTRRRAHIAINLLLDRLPAPSALVLNRLIRAAGREPVERDTLYNVVTGPEAPDTAAVLQ